VHDLQLHRAGPRDRPVLDRLWLTFRHDMAEHRPVLPFPDGTYRDERLRAALTRPDHDAWLLLLDDRPAGLAVTRAPHDGPQVLSSYFVVRGARRLGLGRRGVHALTSQHPGAWEVAYQAANAPAAAFWPRIAAEIDPLGWHQQDRTVPARPELPPDTWVTFTAHRTSTTSTTSSSPASSDVATTSTRRWTSAGDR